METEKYLSGYCRCLDGSRTVEVILEDSKITEADCAYPGCIHRSVCILAQQMDELTE